MIRFDDLHPTSANIVQMLTRMRRDSPEAAPAHHRHGA
jgi:hypothetical protein